MREKLRPFASPASVAAIAAFFLMTVQPRSSFAAAPFRTDDPDPVEVGHGELNVFFAGTHTRVDSAGTAPTVELNYGVLDGIHLHAAGSLTYDSVSQGTVRYGLGDSEAGAKIRFLKDDEEGWLPSLTVAPILVLPTAAAHLGPGTTRAFVPFWAQKSFDRWTSYGGGGYWINPGQGNRNYWYLGWVNTLQLTDRLNAGLEVFHQTADAVGGRDQTGFTVGAAYDISENHHVQVGIGRGLQHAGETNALSYFLGYKLTF